MLEKLLSHKIDHRLIILSALILLDAFTFVVFDVIASAQGGGGTQAINTLADAGWILNLSHIIGLLGGQYSLNFIWASIGGYYSTNIYIINKVAVILISGAVVAAIYRYAPVLLPVCYGYLLGIAGVGVFDGLQNIGAISGSELAALPFDFKIIPQAVMAICVVAGGIISLSKATAYLFSQLVALQMFEEKYKAGFRPSFISYRVPFVDNLFKNIFGNTTIPGKMEGHKVTIPGNLLPEYEKNIRELADLDTQNSIEAIQRSYDLVNQMAKKYGVDQYQVMYDVYKEKSGSIGPRDSFSTVRENVLDKGL